MKPTFLLTSRIDSLAVYARLYEYRKAYKLSEKALFVLLYLYENGLLDTYVETSVIGKDLHDGDEV